MKITITGDPGSGKSTVGKYLAKEFGLSFHSMGDLYGELALQKGVDILTILKMAEIDPSIDEQIDEKQIYIGEHEEDFVIDSRLGWYFIPHSIKIFLECDVLIAAERIFNDKRADERNSTIKDTVKNIKSRLVSEKKRYKKYYGINYDEGDYDIVVDTSQISKEDVKKLVLEKIKNFK